MSEIAARLDLGRLDLVLPERCVGRWSCALADQSLTWDDSVFDLFGLPRDCAPTRAETVACYREPSRAAMERLRAYAIRHRRGFTIDVEIAPASGGPARWIRLSAAPHGSGRDVTILAGSKSDVTPLYRA